MDSISLQGQLSVLLKHSFIPLSQTLDLKTWYWIFSENGGHFWNSQIAANLCK